MKNPATMLLPAASILLALLSAGPSLLAQDGNVVAHVQIERAGKQQKTRSANSAYAVLWLTPLSGNSPKPQTAQPLGHYRLVQHNKEFSPHLLVVPVGSSVDFPNHDPFYHNVFSLFNGKRFDLGLYESGSDRSVRFDHEGISYIFCNIHPEMGAVIIALRTPYFGTASPDGDVTIRDVPTGTYDLAVWAEGADPKELSGLSRRIEVTSGQQDLGLLHIHANVQETKHKNKFGEDYPPDEAPPY